MTRARRWIAGTAAALALLLAGLALVVHWMLPDHERLAQQVSQRFEKASGVGLTVESAHWSLLPRPSVVLEGLATAQKSPITVRRIVLHPRLSELWMRRIAIASIEVDGAVLPSSSVREFRGRWEGDDPAGALGGAWRLAPLPLERLSLRDITWVDHRDIALAYDADVLFDGGWRPRSADVWRPEVSPAARLHLDRDGVQDRWRTLIEVGGGTWNGSTELHAQAGGRMRLVAMLEPKGVDLSALVRSFGRHTPVEGRFSGRTELDAEGSTVGEMLRSLHTRTRFSMAPATLTGLDLARAVKSAGISRGGRTLLDSLTGTVDTQVTDAGMALRYTGMTARSGVLSATGSASVLDRRLDGEAAVDIVDGVVGVPLKLGGTLDAPELSLTGGALAGAALGSAVLPGVGTAIGARIGQTVEQLFGDDKNRKASPTAGKAPAR